MDITYSIQYLRVNQLVFITFFITPKISGFKPTKQHLRKALLLALIFKKSAAESYRLLQEMYGKLLYLRQRAEIGLGGLKVAISTLKTKNVQYSRKKLKMKALRHYSMKIAVRPLNNCLIH